MPLPSAPTLTAQNPTTQATVQSGTAQQAPAQIPFTRAARKKSRLIGQYGPTTLATTANNLPPISIPANGYMRSLTLDITGTTSGNSAAVAFANDAPFNILSGVAFFAANGDTILSQMDGFALYALNKYGAFSTTGANDPLRDPTFSKTTGSGSTGGSFHFQIDIPLEFDARDGAGALTNMAANQSFLLNLTLNTIANVYTTAPTSAPTVSITITAKYWSAPTPANLQGIPQQQAPNNANLTSIVQVATPNVTPSTQQDIQLPNVGNTIRSLIFIARTSSGARTEVDWPGVFGLEVNNDTWEYLTKNNWRYQMAKQYDLFGGITAAPTLNSLDNGVYVYTGFISDGASGDDVVAGSSNRDLMLVTGSGTGLNINANTWGSGIASLQVLTNSLRIPDVASFYAPMGI